MRFYGKCWNYSWYRNTESFLNNWTLLWEVLQQWLLPVIYIKSMASREYFHGTTHRVFANFLYCCNSLHLWLLINFVLLGAFVRLLFFEEQFPTFMWGNYLRENQDVTCKNYISTEYNTSYKFWVYKNVYTRETDRDRGMKW